MTCDVVRIARLLNDLVVAKTVYDLVKRGYNPSTLYRYLDWLVEYGFVRVVKYGGARYYHLTGLGAELLRTLRKAVIHRVTRILEERGIKYRIWWGDKEVRVVKPVVYVDRTVDLPVNLEDLVELKVAKDAVS
ncbi:MAG: hypothetical protein F7B95_04160 [Desulfurococcales archaeon]|nr:hypothetical protein [Desulfurococcales archaeon]